MNSSFASRIVGSIGVLLLCTGVDAASVQTPIDFSTLFNGTQGRYGSYVIPSGNTTLAGVDFALPADPVHYLSTWDAINGGSGTRVMDLNLTGLGQSLYGVQTVYTLINLSWGQSGQNLTDITFYGSQGAVFTFELVDGYDVRDWYDGAYANTLTAPHAQTVWSASRRRIDMQTINLPATFVDEFLTRIVVTDTGSQNVHRAIVYGLTALNDSDAPVGVPAVAWLLGGGLLALRWFSFRPLH